MSSKAITRLVLGYALVSLLYITFSDWLLFQAGVDPQRLNELSMLKGWGFVLLTSAILCWLLLRLRARESGRYQALLDNHHAIFLVLDPDSGRIVDVSRAAESFYGWSRRQLIGKPINEINTLSAAELEAEMIRARRNEVPVFHFRHRLASGEVRDVDVQAGPVELDGRELLFSVIHDVTEDHDNVRALQRLNYLYTLLSRSMQALQYVRDKQTLYQQICDLAVEEGEFILAWIGMQDDKGGVRVLAYSGTDKSFIEEVRLGLQNHKHSPAADMLTGGHLVLSNDFLGDSRTQIWHAQAAELGIRSSGTFPFRIAGEMVGTLNVYAGEKNYFTDRECETLQGIADEISFGLNNIGRLLALETGADVIAKSPVVLFRWQATPGWPVEFVSENVERWGYSAADLLSGQLAFSKIVYPDDLAQVEAEVAGFSGSMVTEFEQQYRIVTATGEVRWVQDQTRIVRDSTGQPRYFQGTLTDINEQRDAQLALEDSENRFRRAIEEAPVPIMMHAEDGEVLALSDTWVELSGYRREELGSIGQWTRLAYHDDSAQVGEVIQSLYELTERRDEGEFEIHALDGRRLTWVFSSVGLGRAIDGRRVAISIAVDVTERKAAVQALASSEAQQRRILEHSPNMLFVNRQDQVAYMNPAGLKLLEADSAEQILGRSVYDLFVPDFHEQISQRMARMRIQPGLSAPAAVEYMRALDGQSVPVRITAVSYKVEDTVEILVTGQDVRSELEAQQQINDYLSKLERSIFGTATAISHMVELRDPYTAGHERRVGALAAAIAAEMGLDDHTQQGLRLAGQVHDVGKIQVPSEILSKPGRLSETEFALVKAHAQNGYEVLKDIDFPWPVADVARQHHERIDGSGYPQGLKGDEILLEARITAVADVVESMSSHRPYRPSLGIDVALREIEHGMGTSYDSEVGAACLNLFRNKGYQITD
ncbi:MAG: hypothetical protein PsegKO_06310 [Pseudohongiellaceae bacterium]